MKSTLAFAAVSLLCSTSVLGAHLKNSLAQQSCTCSIPTGATTVGLPQLGSAQYNSYSSAAALSSGSSLSTIPDSEVIVQGASECCSCNSGSHSSASSGSKNRHFDILGSIVFNETVTWGE